MTRFQVELFLLPALGVLIGALLSAAVKAQLHRRAMKRAKVEADAMVAEARASLERVFEAVRMPDQDCPCPNCTARRERDAAARRGN